MYNYALRTFGIGESCIGEAEVGVNKDGSPRTIQWYAKRGSPMGTPLSFIVLSWINGLCMSPFDGSRTHGDDAVGVCRKASEWFYGSTKLDGQIADYKSAIDQMGASVNVDKTFISSYGWTMCEVFGLDVNNVEVANPKVFYAPPCISPDSNSPPSVERRTPDEYKNRMERAVVTKFKYIRGDPRLHIPEELGGLGYTQRGLKISEVNRKRLAYMVSLGADHYIKSGIIGKDPFVKETWYPQSLSIAPRKPKTYWRIYQKATDYMAKYVVYGNNSGSNEHSLNDLDRLVPVSYDKWSDYISHVAENKYREDTSILECL
jgi:hypothetical protein